MRATGGKPVVVTREKFDKTFNAFKKDPFASARPHLTAEVMSQSIPGMDMTVGEMVKKQEKAYLDFYQSIDNPVEIESAAVKPVN